jgi:hypothetical protein
MQKKLNLNEAEPEWLALLRTATTADGASVASVARSINMPRPSLSMLLTGTYPAKLEKVSKKYAAKVLQQYRNRVPCPHLRISIGNDECRTFASAQQTTSCPDKLAHWRACRRCETNPLKSTGATP